VFIKLLVEVTTHVLRSENTD